MKKDQAAAAFICFFALLGCSLTADCTSLDGNQNYIVHIAKWQIPPVFNDHISWFQSILASVSSDAKFVYTYKTVLHGFSVRLSPGQAAALLLVHGVLAVFPDNINELHTTRTPQFLGLNPLQGLLPESDSGNDIVIGLLDTGVWPESRSFSDAGLGPVPAKWKGACDEGDNFTTSNCNRKLIGARFFPYGYYARYDQSRSPRDDQGHGTHTSSIAGGAYVEGASLLGYANGTARGMAPRARIAMYKVCWSDGCYDSDILAGMEAAIEDGVDIISISLGYSRPLNYSADSIAIGAYAAIEKGIFVSCSAGNSGPVSYTVGNTAPWIATIGAGTIDRDFPSYAILGNGKNFTGASFLVGDQQLKKEPTIPLVYSGNASISPNMSAFASLCYNGSLIPEKVKGKIVVCDRGDIQRLEKGAVVKAAGGVGMIVANTLFFGEEVLTELHFLPATHVGYRAGEEIRKYIFSNPNATATIQVAGPRVGIKPAPMVADFSSRGPNPVTEKILKPDMFAPGVYILAGWTGSVGPTSYDYDNRRVEFNIISGTSMSCPHAAGLAALLRAAHPEWSPAAIRSALMTTAYTNSKDDSQPILDLATRLPSTPLAHGAGHVDPEKALDPGLVYDLTPDDYLKFLCGQNYSLWQIYIFSQSRYDCKGNTMAPEKLNYPSFVVQFKALSSTPQSIMLTRTVTNVGPAYSSYISTVSLPLGVDVVVSPKVLHFKKKNEKMTYNVSFTSNTTSFRRLFGNLTWSDGRHIVKSPILFLWD